MKKHFALATFLLAGLTGLGQAQASTTTLNFSCFSSINGIATDCATGAAQLSVDVRSSLQGVSFTFKNNVGIASSITEIYFDASQSSLNTNPLPTITDSDDATGSAVSFKLDASPTNLPGGENLAQPFTVSSTAFKAESTSGKGGITGRGINAASEWLTMDYSLKATSTYADVISDINSGKLRIGLHVVGFDHGDSTTGSASFINTPVPVPAAVWLLGSGLIGLVGVARRKN